MNKQRTLSAIRHQLLSTSHELSTDITFDHVIRHSNLFMRPVICRCNDSSCTIFRKPSVLKRWTVAVDAMRNIGWGRWDLLDITQKKSSSECALMYLSFIARRIYATKLHVYDLLILCIRDSVPTVIVNTCWGV